RIMYVHVPAILTGYAAIGLVLVASVAYLWTGRAAWERVAAAGGELAVCFIGLTLATGSIWGKPTWGTWWTWDARLTSTAILFVIYLGYLLLRSGARDRRRPRRPDHPLLRRVVAHAPPARDGAEAPGALDRPRDAARAAGERRRVPDDLRLPGNPPLPPAHAPGRRARPRAGRPLTAGAGRAGGLTARRCSRGTPGARRGGPPPAPRGRPGSAPGRRPGRSRPPGRPG